MAQCICIYITPNGVKCVKIAVQGAFCADCTEKKKRSRALATLRQRVFIQGKRNGQLCQDCPNNVLQRRTRCQQCLDVQRLFLANKRAIDIAKLPVDSCPNLDADTANVAETFAPVPAIAVTAAAPPVIFVYATISSPHTIIPRLVIPKPVPSSVRVRQFD